MAKDIKELSKPVENKEDKKDDKKVVANKKDDKKEVTANAKTPNPETVDEYVAKAPPEIRESLKLSVNTMNAEKKRLVEIIKVNEQNTFTEEHLNGMDIQMLQAFAKIAGPIPTDNEESRMIPLYTGQGNTPLANDGKMPEPLPLPKMDYKPAESKTA